jgi:hypothetical protein
VRRATWLAIAPRRVTDLPDLLVERVATASTAVNPTTSPETAHRAVLVSAERAEARVPEATTATDAVSLVTWPETAPTPPWRVPRAAEAATASVAVSSVTWPETAPTARLLLREELPDRATASSAVSLVTSLETAEPKWSLREEREKKRESVSDESM